MDMDIKIKKQKGFYNTIAKNLVNETDADYVDRMIMTIRGHKEYVHYIFYFPWNKKGISTGIAPGRLCKVLNYDLYEEFEKFKTQSILHHNIEENFAFKWGDYFKYVSTIYGITFEECFTIWEIYSKSMKEKYNLD